MSSTGVASPSAAPWIEIRERKRTLASKLLDQPQNAHNADRNPADSAITAQTPVMTREMANVVGITCASSPMRSMLAEAFCSLAGEMTLASPPPIPLAAATSSSAVPMLSAVERCSSSNEQ
jgi:hypothetical protein